MQILPGFMQILPGFMQILPGFMQILPGFMQILPGFDIITAWISERYKHLKVFKIYLKSL
jgi:hypothetical protein